jgi:hypothetical protein
MENNEQNELMVQKDRMKNIIKIIIDRIDNHIYPETVFEDEMVNDEEMNIMRHVIRFHTIVKNISYQNANVVRSVMSENTTFIDRVVSFIMNSEYLREKKVYIGFTFVIQSLLDKGVQKEHLILSPNHTYKLALKHYIERIKSKEEFDALSNEDKLKFTTIWEVYADLYPEEEDMVMYLENIGYHQKD